MSRRKVSPSMRGVVEGVHGRLREVEQRTEGRSYFGIEPAEPTLLLPWSMSGPVREATSAPHPRMSADRRLSGVAVALDVAGTTSTSGRILTATGGTEVCTWSIGAGLRYTVVVVDDVVPVATQPVAEVTSAGDGAEGLTVQMVA